MADVRAIVRRSLPILIPAAIVLVIVFLTQLPKVIDFINSGSVGNVTDTNSKLRYVVSPLETLGIWPSGSWLLGTHDVAHFWLFGADRARGARVRPRLVDRAARLRGPGRGRSRGS